jgi:iron uptake system EfeUOB component EfeO/EfeM
LKSKSIINVNTVELLEEVAVSMVTGNEERRTLNEYWLDLEAAEDGEMFLSK